MGRGDNGRYNRNMDNRGPRRDSRWYYPEGKRYVPRSMMESDQRRQRRNPNPTYRRRNEYRPEPTRQNTVQHSEQMMEKSRSMQIAKGVFVTSLSLLLLVISTVAILYIYLHVNIFSKITYIDDTQLAVTENLDDVVIDDVDSETVDGIEEMTQAETETLESIIQGGLVNEDKLYREDGVTNILLLGTDNRGFSLKGSRSDAIIILSINEKTKKIIMTSVMRDICVSIPGRSSLDKINAAYAYGGAPLAVKTVETNFGVDIDRFIAVNFFSFIDIVDELGGLRISINEQERLVMNRYIGEINAILGQNQDNGKLYRTGEDLLLTGKQVLGYVRNRYTGDGDFARTERQRIVLGKLIDECKKADISTMLNVIEAAAPYMSTNYTQGDLMNLVADALEYLDYELITSRLPIDGTWYHANLNGAAVISIEMSQNRRELINRIYEK